MNKMQNTPIQPVAFRRDYDEENVQFQQDHYEQVQKINIFNERAIKDKATELQE